METTTQLYWLTRLDSIQFLFGVLAILGFLIFMGIIIFTVSGDIDYKDKITLKQLKIFAVSFGISLLGSILIPSKDEVVFIVAGGKTIDFIKNDSSINKLPGQTTKYISEILQKEINKLDKEDK
jgi:hypothetical protein